MNHEGTCHCGSVVLWFETATAPDNAEVRACGCSFCRRHGARVVSDPAGWLEVRGAPGALTHYRFASETVDFLLCSECGVYVAATIQDGDTTRGIVNVVGVGLDAFTATALPMDYSAESPEEKLVRRRAKWTPAAVVEAMPNA